MPNTPRISTAICVALGIGMALLAGCKSNDDNTDKQSSSNEAAAATVQFTGTLGAPVEGPVTDLTGVVGSLTEPLLGLTGALGLTSPTELPMNDVLAAFAGLYGAQIADMKTPQVLKTLPLQPVPRAACDAQSDPLAAQVQGRVTWAAVNAPGAADGWRCNLSLVSHFNSPGGFRVWRYTDKQGQTCAYYDTSFVSPLNIVSLAGGPTLGVFVLNMDDPAQPVHTDTLTSLAMLAPHESLNLNRKRGLLAAEVGNAATLPGSMAIYDVSEDCQHPRLLGTEPTIFGHESGFSPDGKTFWIGGGFGDIQAVDVSDPTHPKTIWTGAYYSHGLNLSADGNVLFHTDTINGNLGLIDVSEIQARKPNPQVHDISRVTWPTASIPQNSVPFTSNGHHYLLEFEEFAIRINPPTMDDKVGAARILNIDDLTQPFIVSNIRLEVNMRDAHKAAAGDPSALPPNKAVGYAFHYCAIPTRDNPQIAACTALNSGLRVFDISDPAHPREVAYYIAPPKAGSLLGLLPGNLAFSQPAFDRERRQIWYTDAKSGFYVLQLHPGVWTK